MIYLFENNIEGCSFSDLRIQIQVSLILHTKHAWM